MNEISTADLKTKLDGDQSVKLVMVGHAGLYTEKHIQGSINVATLDEVITKVEKEESVVVYCTNPGCADSIAMYNMMVEAGYTNVTRYAEGLEGWEASGHDLEGVSNATPQESDGHREM